MSRKPDAEEMILFCGYCGERLPDIGEGESGNCPQCMRLFGRRRVKRRPPLPPKEEVFDCYYTHESVTRMRDPVLAALLSTILPGAGQVYNNEFFKGLFVFLTCWLVIPYFLGIFDAYVCSERKNRTWQAVAVRR